MNRWESWPLLLAGPMLRHVDPRVVSVFVAVREAANLELQVFEGPVDATGPVPAPLVVSESTATLRVGSHLHLALVVARIPEGSLPLKPGGFYSYNLVIRHGGTTETLASLGLLRERTQHPPHLPLGYVENLLPGFETPPLGIEELRLAHGSCRKIHGLGHDGLAALDDVLLRLAPGERRPQQLFLTGDQLYADDVPMALMRDLTGNARALTGPDDTSVGVAAAERIPVPTQALSAAVIKQKGFPTETLLNPDGTPVVDSQGANQVSWIPVDAEHLPGGWRRAMIRDVAEFNADNLHSHMLGFGEYCALYLAMFSTATWPESSAIPEHPSWDLHRPRALPRLHLGERVYDCLLHRLQESGASSRLPEAIEEIFVEELRGLAPGFVHGRARATQFFSTLPKAMRVLANVPTWMIFDDHDVTDDWLLTRDWVERTRTSPLGRSIQRNALLAFGLFQAWGNEPDRFSPAHREPTEGTSTAATLLSAATRYLPDGKLGPDLDAIRDLDGLLGLATGSDQAPGGTKPSPMHWHFQVRGPRHRVFVLDARTRRSFRTLTGPPAVIPEDRLEAQLSGSDPLHPEEVVFVVSSVPVFGPPAIEEVLQPLGAKRRWPFQVPSHNSVERRRDDALKRRDLARWCEQADADIEPEGEQIQGVDMEQWAFDTPAFEAFIRRLATFGRAVILSGDVHYSLSGTVDYWELGPETEMEPSPQPVPLGRILQLTSSSLCNEQPEALITSLQAASGQWFLGEARFPIIRLGWNKPGQDHVKLPPGAVVPLAYRARLLDQPAVIGATGWPVTQVGGQPQPTEIEQPDFVWRMRMVQDLRTDEERKDALWQPPPQIPDDPDRSLFDTYAAMLRRHAAQIDNQAPRRVVWRSNVAIVRLIAEEVPEDETEGETEEFEPRPLTLEHRLYYATPGEDGIGTGGYTVHRMSLQHPGDDAPGLVFPS